jgi:DNA-binding MarR family transcriptional regulator
MVDDTQKLPYPEDNVRRLSIQFLSEIERRLNQHLGGTVLSDVRSGDLQIGILATFRPRSLSSLARELKITRQAVHNAVQRLKVAGFVETEQEEGSARDKIVVLTPKGIEATAIAKDFLVKLNIEAEAILGKKSYEQFLLTLRTLTGAMKLRELE